MTWPQRPGGRDLPMGKKKKKPRRVEGQWTPATPHVQDGALVADAGNHEDEGIPLPRPDALPHQGLMGTMESSTAAEDPATTSVNGYKDVPSASVNSGDSLSDSSLRLDISDIQGHVDLSRHISDGDSIVSQSDPRSWRLPGLDLDIIAKAQSCLSSHSSFLASNSNSADSSFSWSGLSLASPVETHEDASGSRSPRSGEVAPDLGAIGQLPADDATTGVGGVLHDDADFGACDAEKVKHTGTRSLLSGEGASVVNPGVEEPGFSATVGAKLHDDEEFGAIDVGQVNHNGTRSLLSGEGASDVHPGVEAPGISAAVDSAQDHYCMVCNSTEWEKTGVNRLLLCGTPNCLRGGHLRCLGLYGFPGEPGFVIIAR